MDFLYSLYDALVSINVPSDKARAVVDAMERDMGTTLATKQDLDVVRLATKQDLEIVRRDMGGGFELVRRDMESGLASVRRDMESGFESVKRETENRFALVDQRFDALESSFDHKIVSARDQLQLKMDGQELRIVVKLGSMLFLGFGLIIAVLKLWV